MPSGMVGSTLARHAVWELTRYAPGKKTNSTQLVIRLTPIPAADSTAGVRTSRPLTLDEAEPYGVYFFQSSMLRVLTREGICPKKKSQPGRSSLLNP